MGLAQRREGPCALSTSGADRRERPGPLALAERVDALVLEVHEDDERRALGIRERGPARAAVFVHP